MSIDFSRPPDTDLARAQTAAKRRLDDELFARKGWTQTSHAPAVTAPKAAAPAVESGPATAPAGNAGLGQRERKRTYSNDIGGNGSPSSPPLAQPGPTRTATASTKPIPGFPGYEITRDGEVFRNGKTVGQSERCGTKRVQLRVGGVNASRTIERLLAETWGVA